MKNVATVTTILGESRRREELSSLRAGENRRQGWDRIAVVPRGIKIPGYIACEFPRRWFRSRGTLQSLFLTCGFYEQFRQYDYIFVTEVDPDVFRTREIEQFCTFDFVAKPCRRGYNVVGEPIFAGCGGGDCSLRRVSAFLRICTRMHPWRRWRTIAALRTGRSDEGYFWAREACVIDPEFAVAPDEVSSIFGRYIDGVAKSAVSSG